MSTLGQRELESIEHMAEIDHAQPRIDRARVEEAMRAHFEELGVAPRPVLWAEDLEETALRFDEMKGASTANDVLRMVVLHDVMRSATWRGAIDAARSAAKVTRVSLPLPPAERAVLWSAAPALRPPFSALKSALEAVAEWYVAWLPAEAGTPEQDRWARIWRPFLDAYQAGLWHFGVTDEHFIAVPRPGLRTAGEQLHCETGPAVHWAAGASYYFLRGVRVPERVVMQPETLRAAEILQEANLEVRRVMLWRFGEARYLEEIGARPLAVDEYGELFRAEIPGDEPLAMVRVANATPEPDGSLKSYWLRVPPFVTTPHEAVAWTFGVSAAYYAPAIQT